MNYREDFEADWKEWQSSKPWCLRIFNVFGAEAAKESAYHWWLRGRLAGIVEMDRYEITQRGPNHD